MREVRLYISGQYNGDSHTGGWACLVSEEKLREYSGSEQGSKSQRMALLSLFEGLCRTAHLPRSTYVVIETDSAFLADGIANEASRWQQRNWKDRRGRQVPDHDLWRRIMRQLDRHDGEVLFVDKPDEGTMLSRAQHIALSALSKEKAVTIHSDGSYLPGRNAGGWGAVIETDEGVRKTSGFMQVDDSNLMELVAAVKSIEKVGKDKDILLFTDSRFVFNGVRELSQTRAAGWRHPDGTPVRFTRWWKQLYQAIDRSNLRVEWVRGHSGIEFNEMADKLAGEASQHCLMLLRKNEIKA